MSKKSNTFGAIKLAPIPGSSKLEAFASRIIKKELDGRKIITFSVQVRMAADEDMVHRILEDISMGRRGVLTVAELESVTGSKPEDIALVTAELQAAGLKVLPRTAGDISHGIIRVKGTYAAAARFLPGLKLSLNQDTAGKNFIARSGELLTKEGLPIDGVFGLDTRSVAHTHYRIAPTAIEPHAGGLDHGTARDVARAQGIPVDTLKLARFCSGYISLSGDNGAKMQAGLKISAQKSSVNAAKVKGLPINGAKLDGDLEDGGTIENRLDMITHCLLNPDGWCIVATAPNDDNSFGLSFETMNAFLGVQDGDEFFPFFGYSCSWGNAESLDTLQSLRRRARAMLAARLRGLIVTSATGDDGSRDKTKAPTPDAPSDIPNGIGAAGLTLVFDPVTGKVTGQKVWNSMARGGGATGGGVSAVFDVTTEEKSLGLPDAVFKSKADGKLGHLSATLSDDADPATAPTIFLDDGTPQKVGGTSLSAPFSCIKLCLIQASLIHKIPDMIGFIFAHAREGIFEQVTEAGNNGDYTVQPTDLYALPTGFGVISWNLFLMVAKRVQDGGMSFFAGDVG